MKEGVFLDISNELIKLCNEFIGATGKTFLERQCKFHLKVDLKNIDKSHLAELAKWCQVSGGLIIGNEKAKILKEKVLSLK
jgi:hypothetical protein